MKRLYWVAVILFGFLAISAISPLGEVSADVAVPCGNGTFRLNCDGPQAAGPCSGLASCLAQSSLRPWKLYLINVAIETGVAMVFVILLKKPKRLVLAVIAVNLVSWPILYHSIANVQTVGPVIVGEVAVWIFEAVGIYLLCFGKVSRKIAISLSTITNASTIVASFLLLPR
jgi:hypothetical protein